MGIVNIANESILIRILLKGNIMADAYGALTFTKSEDCVFDGPSLVRALNELEWDISGGNWIYYDDDQSICFSDYGSQYPTVFPLRQTVIYCVNQETDECYEKQFEEMTEEDWKNFDDSEIEACSVEELRDRLALHVKQGWIEIACCANEKCRYVMFETLRIHASGEAESMFTTSGPCVEVRTVRENVGAFETQTD